MRRSRFTEERMIGFLKQAEAGLPIKDLCRKGGFSDATFYKWRAKYGGMVVLDVWSRRVVGWSIGEQMTTELVLTALNMALEQRRAGLAEGGVIHHSEQGSQYTSIAFGERCKTIGVRPSMGTVGDA